MLKDVPTEMLASVVQKTMLECKFLPSIAELCEACKSLSSTVKGEKVVPDWGEWPGRARIQPGRFPYKFLIFGIALAIPPM